MYDAFGVERSDLIEKGWKGEPGDKRNTKYALAFGAAPVAGVGYAIYRQTKTGRKNREASIKAAKKKKRIHKAMTGERGDKRNTKYLAAGLAGDITGTRIGQHLGAASAGTTRAKGMKAYRASIDNALNIDYKGPLRGPSYVKHGAPTIHGGIAGGLAGGAAATGIYYAYRQSDQSQKNRAASMKAKR